MNRTKIILFSIIFSCVLLLSADKTVKMNSSATDLFESDVFELEVILENFDPSKVSVFPPDFEKNLRRIYGPSQSQSTSIINGDITRSITLTYQFSPKRSGIIKIDPFVVSEGKKKYRSNTLNLNVVKSGGKIPATRGGKQQRLPMFLRTTATKTTPYLGEMIKVEYTLYLDPSAKIRMPSPLEQPKMKGFVKDDIEIPKEKSGKLIQKIYKGKKYNTLLLKSMWLTASSAGENILDPLVLSVPVAEKKSRKRRKSFFNDPFFEDSFAGDDIFSGFSRYKEKVVKSNAIKIMVQDLPKPGKPADFSGITGAYTIHSSISKDTLDVNDALTLKTTIKGKGSLRDIKELNYKIPDDFEIYEPKRTIKYNKNSKSAGRVLFEQVLIPRFPGTQKITGPEFTYFNPQTGKYVTIKGEDYQIKVGGAKGFVRKTTSSPYAQKEVTLTGEDIRYIKKGQFKYYNTHNKKSGFSNLYAYLILALCIPLLTSLTRKFALKDNQDRSRKRSRKASAFAIKRLKTAIKHKNQNDDKNFYKALEEAIYKYLADKFNISAAGIVIETLASRLREKNVAEDTIQLLANTLAKTASIQFSPAEHSKEELDSDLEQARNLLLKLQNGLK